MRTIVEQQAHIIEFGRKALVGGKIADLFQRAVSSTIDALQVEYCEIVQILKTGEMEIKASISHGTSRFGDRFSAVGSHPSLKPLTFPDDMVLFANGEYDPPLLPKELGQDLNVNSGLCIVILNKQELFGFLCVYSSHERSFSDAEIHFLQSMATILCLAIDRKQSEEEIQSYLLQMQILHHIDEAILSHRSPQDIVKNILHHVRQLIPCMRASVGLYDEDNRSGVIIAVDSGIPTKIQAGTQISSHFEDRDIEAFQNKGFYYVADILRLDRPSPVEKLLLADGVRSYVWIPIYSTDFRIGSLNLSAASPDAFSPQQIELAHKVASSLAVAFQDSRLFEIALANRNQLRKLAHITVEAQEAERQRVSRELHDQAGQALTAIQISLDLVQNELPREFSDLRHIIADAGQLASRTMNDLRLLAEDLRPPELDTLGLQAALEDLCETYSRRYHLKFEFSCINLPVLPDRIMISIYRIVQEALTNIVKHSGAQHVWITFQSKATFIAIQIRDDGCGFEVPEVVTSANSRIGLGVLGMLERVELLRGKIKFKSSPGQGTTINISIPRKG